MHVEVVGEGEEGGKESDTDMLFVYYSPGGSQIG